MACRDEHGLQEHDPYTIQLLTNPSNRIFKHLNSLKGLKNPNYTSILETNGPHVF